MDMLAYAIIGKESKENTETGAGPYTTDMAEAMANARPNNPVLMVSQGKKGEKGSITIKGNLTKIVLEYNPNRTVLAYELKNVVFNFKNKLGENARIAVECPDHGGWGAELIKEVKTLGMKDYVVATTLHNSVFGQFTAEERKNALKDAEKKEIYEMEKISIEMADVHLGPTSYIRHHMREAFPEGNEVPFLRIPNPINGDEYNANAPENTDKPFKVNDTAIDYNNFNIGVVGRGEKLKGVENAARAFNEISEKYPNAHIYFIGKYYTEADNKPVTEESLKKILNEEALERCHFVGMVDNKIMPDVFKTLDCHLFLSEYDNFSGVVLQAALSGVPTVLRNKGGNLDLIETGSGAGAYVVTANDDKEVVEEAVKYISDIAENSKQAKALTAKFAQNIRDKLNLQTIAKTKWSDLEFVSNRKRDTLPFNMQ